MLEPGEIAATQAALDRALVQVQAAEAAASSGRNILGTLAGLFSTGPTALDDAASTSGLLAAASARDLYDGLVRARNAAAESPDPAHEEALQIVELANRLSGSGTSSAIAQSAAAADAAAIVVGSIRDTARQVQNVGQHVGEAFVPTVKWLAVALAALAVVAVVRYAGPRVATR